MLQIWQQIGRALYWLLTPAISVIIRRTTRARILLTCGDKVLVVKSWLGDGRWQLPGGGLHAGEDPLRGAVREMREETGLSLPLEVLSPPQKRRMREHARHYDYYLTTAVVGQPVPPHRQPYELVDVAWVPAAELTDRTAGQDVRDALATWRP